MKTFTFTSPQSHTTRSCLLVRVTLLCVVAAIMTSCVHRVDRRVDRRDDRRDVRDVRQDNRDARW